MSKFGQVCFQFPAFDGAFGPGVGLEVFFQKKKSDADVVISVVRHLFCLLVCRFGYYSTQEAKEKEQLP